MGKRILVVGATNMDFTMEMRSLPAAGAILKEEDGDNQQMQLL